MRRSILLTALAFASLAPAAQAGELLSTTVTTDRCAERTVTTPGSLGWVTARLDAASGDWDLGVLDAETGRRLTGSTSFGAHEVAQTLVAADRGLTVQACRRSGPVRQADLSVDSTALDGGKLVRPSLVMVSTPTQERKNELNELGLDVTEHGGPTFLGVVLYGDEDAAKLRRGNFVYRTLESDLTRSDARQRAADRRYAASVRASALPSGRDTYRRLEDYTSEMKALAADNPDIVKPITLPFKTYEGRSVEGIEITENVNARDGKPVFLNMGLHHAREWPSGEHSIEWAYELINGWRAGNERVRRIMRTTRTIIVPVVNPDGFNVSREAGEAAGAGGGRENPVDDTLNLVVPYEYHRKNCRVVIPGAPDPEEGNCAQPLSTGLQQFGVDPNRNYGGLWGGPGASGPDGVPPGEYAQNYRGTAPFSEPETRNVQALVSSRQVTTLITNHTFSNLVLRPPGIQSLGETPDENAGYKALGDAMAAHNGYESQFGYELYDTTGTTEDWTYYSTGGFGFTFEIGCYGESVLGGCSGWFHPNFEKVVAEYEGTTPAADQNGRDGLGNREAYFIAAESTADASRHSVIAGKVPAPAVLHLTKSFKTRTSPVIDAGVEGEPLEFDDKLETFMDAPGGPFEWHTNPSTRPIVAGNSGRPATGPPSPPHEFAGGVTGTGEPGDDGSALPGALADSDDPLFYNDHRIDVPSGPGVDNAKVAIRIQWTNPVSDWDIRLFRDANSDGVPDDPADPLSVSQNGATDFEQVTFAEPTPGAGLGPGGFVLRVNNYTALPGPAGDYNGVATFQGPDPFQAAQVESWELTCEFPQGNVLQSLSVAVNRGERREVDLSACAAAIRQDCLNSRGGVRGRRLGPAYLGRARARQRAALKGKRLRGRRGIDSYCVTGGGTFRIGYPTTRIKRSIGRGLRRRVRGKAVLVLTSSRRFAVAGLRVGARAGRVRKRLKGERRHRVGKNTWFVKGTKRARLLFKVQGGRVQEVGIGDKRLTRGRAASRRFLRGWSALR